MRRPLAAATLATAALIVGFVALPGAATASPAGPADRRQRVFMNGGQEVPGPGDHDGMASSPTG